MRFSIPPSPPGTWIRVEDDELPHPLLVRLGLAHDGRLVATGLLIEAEGELVSKDLRLPLARIVGEFAAAASKRTTFKRLWGELLGTLGIEVVWEGGGPAEIPGSTENSDLWLRALLPVPTRTSPIARVRPGRRGHTKEHYEKVATAYRRAQREHPRAPIQALMTELHATEPTVHRWLRTARERGFLKGEQP